MNDEKDKIVRKNILYAFLIKGGSLFISFFSMPIYIRFFNDDATLGIWFTILSLLSWFLSFDFGLGNGLRNKLVVAIERKNSNDIKEYISSGYVTLFIVSLLIYLIILPFIIYLNWNKILNINTISNNILRITVIINFTTVMLQFFLRLITFIMYSIQKSSINNLISFIISLSQIIFVLMLPSFNNEKNLIILSMIHMFTTITPLILATFIIFKKTLKGMLPSKNFFNKSKAKEIFTSGGIIFVNQIFYMLLTNTNVYLVAYYTNPQNVVEYQIYYRVFMIVGSIFMLALSPIWSAVTKARVEGDFQWINKYFKITLFLAGIIFLGQFLMIIPLQLGFNIWLGESAPNVNFTYAFVFAVFSGVFTVQNAVSVFAMGFDKAKLQMVLYIFAFVMKILLMLLLVDKYNYWITFVFIDIIVFIPYIIAEYIHVKKLITNLKFAGRESK